MAAGAVGGDAFELPVSPVVTIIPVEVQPESTCSRAIASRRSMVRAYLRLTATMRAANQHLFMDGSHNAVRLQLHALAYNLGNFMRTLVLPDAVEQWSLTSLREKLIKIGAKIVRHERYVTFQMAEVVIPRDLFADILRRIDRLRPPPAPA